MDKGLRDLVRAASGGFCEYCRAPERFDRLPFQNDHVIAQKHGGLSESDNLAWSCFDCNLYKGPNIAGIDPLSGALTALFHPRRHHWEEHFRCDSGVFVGLTPEGRTTIEVLRINLARRVAFREQLLEEGVYPLS